MQSTGEDRTTIHNNIGSNCIYETRIEGYFCSDVVFNLSRRILSEKDLKVLEKSLNFSPIQNKTNKRTNFDEFYGCMRAKCYFGNKTTK